MTDPTTPAGERERLRGEKCNSLVMHRWIAEFIKQHHGDVYDRACREFVASPEFAALTTRPAPAKGARERIAKEVEAHAELLKHTSHRDGIGMGWQAGEDLCREIADRIRSATPTEGSAAPGEQVALRVLAAFARTAPGRLPGRVQEAVNLVEWESPDDVLAPTPPADGDIGSLPQFTRKQDTWLQDAIAYADACDPATPTEDALLGYLSLALARLSKGAARRLTQATPPAEAAPDPEAERLVALEEALRPFANYACDEPHVDDPECHNCRAARLLRSRTEGER